MMLAAWRVVCHSTFPYSKGMLLDEAEAQRHTLLDASCASSEIRPQIAFKSLDASSLKDFKTLNQVIFPVKYSDRFYAECQTPMVVAKLAYCGPKLVGAAASRFEPSDSGLSKLYIMTLGVYAAYREQSIGSQLLQLILDEAHTREGIAEAYLHVQVSNSNAIDFYSKRGFYIAETMYNYYKRIQPPHAVVLRCPFRKKDTELPL